MSSDENATDGDFTTIEPVVEYHDADSGCSVNGLNCMNWFFAPLFIGHCVATNAYRDKVTLEERVGHLESRLANIDTKILKAQHRLLLQEVLFPHNDCAALVTEDDFDIVTQDELKDFDNRVEPLLQILSRGGHELGEQIAKIRTAYPHVSALCRILRHANVLARERITAMERQQEGTLCLLQFVKQRLEEVKKYLLDSAATDYLVSCAPGTLFRRWLDLAETIRITGFRIRSLKAQLYPSDVGGRTYYNLWRAPFTGQSPMNKVRQLTTLDSARLRDTIGSYIETGEDMIYEVFAPHMIETYTKEAIDPQIKATIGVYRRRIDDNASLMAQIEMDLVHIDPLIWQ